MDHSDSARFRHARDLSAVAADVRQAAGRVAVDIRALNSVRKMMKLTQVRYKMWEPARTFVPVLLCLGKSGVIMHRLKLIVISPHQSLIYRHRGTLTPQSTRTSVRPYPHQLAPWMCASARAGSGPRWLHMPASRGQPQ